MWIIYALLSALFASLTAICAKIGVKDIDSNLATAIRTTVILLLTWGIVFFFGTPVTDQVSAALYVALSFAVRHFDGTVVAVLFQGDPAWRRVASGSRR